MNEKKYKKNNDLLKSTLFVGLIILFLMNVPFRLNYSYLCMKNCIFRVSFFEKGLRLVDECFETFLHNKLHP